MSTIKRKTVKRFSSYVRFCKRCGEIYRTHAKTGRICEKCVKPNRGVKMKLSEFKEKMLKANEAGNQATLEHKEKFPYHKSKKKQEKTGYHPPATREDCEICKKIFANYKDIMELQEKEIGITGIPVDSLLSAIKITENVLRMKEEEK